MMQGVMVVAKANNLFNTVCVDADTGAVVWNQWLREDELLSISQHYRRLNFSIALGVGLREDCGSFDRLGGLVLISVGDDGYLMWNCAIGSVVRMTKEMIINIVDTKGVKVQNAIIRNRGISAYPGKQFYKRGTSQDIQVPSFCRDLRGTVPAPNKNSKARVRKSPEKVLSDRGITCFNPDVLPKSTMRVIASSVLDGKTASRCKEINSHPALKTDAVKTLVGYAVMGVDVNKYCDESIGQGELDAKCRKAYMQACGDLPTPAMRPRDEELVAKCIKYKDSIILGK